MPSTYRVIYDDYMQLLPKIYLRLVQGEGMTLEIGRTKIWKIFQIFLADMVLAYHEPEGDLMLKILLNKRRTVPATMYRSWQQNRGSTVWISLVGIRNNILPQRFWYIVLHLAYAMAIVISKRVANHGQASNQHPSCLI